MITYDITTEVKQLEASLRMAKHFELDLLHLREELYGLGSNIAAALGDTPEAAGLFYEYEELFKQEQALYSSVDAYEAGVYASASSQNEDQDMKEKGFLRYLAEFHMVFDNNSIVRKRHEVCYKLCNLLGKEKNLLFEYNELFVKCNGVVSANIYYFYEHGFNAA